MRKYKTLQSSRKEDSNDGAKGVKVKETSRNTSRSDAKHRLPKLIKIESSVIHSINAGARDRKSVAEQFCEWGKDSEDDTVETLTDMLAGLKYNLGEAEEVLAQDLEESRCTIKQVRDTMRSVQPTRDHRNKVMDQIAHLQHKEPTSAKLRQYEQELVRAEAECLVGEAQLTNITRATLKEAGDVFWSAYIERAEKQIILAKTARKLLALIDDTPVVPGDSHKEFERAEEAKRIFQEMETVYETYQPNLEPIRTAKLQRNLMPEHDNISDNTGNYAADVPLRREQTTTIETTVIADSSL